MKSSAVLLTIIMYVAVVSARNLRNGDLDNEDSENGFQERHLRDRTNNQMRHRRRTRQSYYPNFNPYFPFDDYPGRRRNFYNRQDEDLFPRILNLLEEIDISLKRLQAPPPPPPPQIIVIPYPYQTHCQNQNNTVIPGIKDRLPPLEDKNQNWGTVIGDLGYDINSENNGARPIDLASIESDEPTVKPPPVDHGTKQAGMTTAKPALSEPGRCKAAILVCCQDTSSQVKQECFASYGCNKTYSVETACHPLVVKRVVDEFAKAYAPSNNT